jgi:hypothetical protein
MHHIQLCRHQESNIIELLKPIILLEKLKKPCQEVLQYPNLQHVEQIKLGKIACDAIKIAYDIEA